MKYIKTYEALSDDFTANIKDILLEITDLGYEYSIRKYGNENIITIYNNFRQV